MPETRMILDLELCRMILLRTEEVLTSEKPRGPSNYVFEGFSNDLVAYNIKINFDRNLILAKERSEWDRNMLRYWPVAITKKGVAFLEAAKDENLWSKAVETVKEMGEIQALRKMEKVFMGIAKQRVTKSETDLLT